MNAHATPTVVPAAKPEPDTWWWFALAVIVAA